MIEIESYYAKTFQGPYLNINEDDIIVDLESRLFGVFDGFGGGTVGDTAVAMAREKVGAFFTKVSVDPDSTMPYFFSPNYLLETNCLINALEIAHATLINTNKDRPMNERAGVSCLVGIVSENILSLASTGNCAGFLYRGNKVSVISPPDTITPIGSIENNMTNRTFPLSGLGLFERLMPKVWEISVRKGDKICLLTDGVYSRLATDDIKTIIESTITDELNIVKRLFSVSNDRGNLDNQSAIVITL
ncbi:PP2C family serine/threonine-protein phosphatase [Bacteriovorax sp. Seq25_V]|uniref:PP2C family protein-serine/threonine phosphatase n=1 Tax=Bacteriovorax sp. Seq25_V TaxID=1201288 RepID=UPI000389F3D2|nr:PP2C family serine/threonine-protein phosphatase [Bacteriovorax sp. Seq25_V]EQC46803.1 stage II sporulation protein E [Bacteriovorax sp. Seq25_V]